MTLLTIFMEFCIELGITVILLALYFVYVNLSSKKSKNKNKAKSQNTSPNKNMITKKSSVNNNYLAPLPTVFTKKYSDEQDNDNFESEFDLNSYKLPDGFIDFCNSDKTYSLGEDMINIYPIKFDEIIEHAENLILGSDVFCIPPHCIPFCDDESGGHVYYCLDYNLCGKQGSPRIIYVDNEFIDWGNNENITEYDFREKIVADSFAEFLKKIKEVK